MMRVEGFPTCRGAIDIEAARGDLVLIRGANGAGKTSLLRTIAGLEAPVSPARVRLDGAVALCMQDARDTLVGLTVEGEFRLRGAALPENLAAIRDRECATLSSGEARRVALATVDARAPTLLLLDEPAEGLDASARARLTAAVDAARARGAVVAVDHAGVLASRATRVVDLTPARPATATSASRLAAPRGCGVVVHAPAGSVARDGRVVHLPAVRLDGGFHVLSGPNGAGKTTMLLRLAGALGARPRESEVRIDGAPPAPGHNVRLALSSASDTMTRETVAQELAGADEEIARALVPPTILHRHPLALSGGEAQRVQLARVLGTRAPLYLLDEPEAHLDTDGRDALAAAIARRVGEGACVLAATHDDALASAAVSVLKLEAPT